MLRNNKTTTSNGHLIKRHPWLITPKEIRSKNSLKGKFGHLFDKIILDPNLIDLIKRRNIELKPLDPVESSIWHYWSIKLRGAPGRNISGLEKLQNNRYRIRFENGAIYRCGQTFAWVYGAIGIKYESMGGVNSWLGCPLNDESDFDGGRVSEFAHGNIYWWPDLGAIELNNIVVQYAGLVCFGETDTDGFFTDSDEPYVILGVNSALPIGGVTAKSTIYNDVDSGESKSDLIELYRNKPYGLTLSIMLMEHDEGDPDKYKEMMTAAVSGVASGITAATTFIPVVGPVVSAVAGPLLSAAVPSVSSALNEALGTDDEEVAHTSLFLSPKQLIVLATRTENVWENGATFKLQSPLLSGQGASYKVYFGMVPA